MRADPLAAVLLLLQQRGQATAAEVAGRERAETASGAIVANPLTRDRQAPSPPSHLDDVQRAVTDGEQPG